MRGPLDYTSHVGLIPQVPGKLKGLESATWTEVGMAPTLFSPPELGIFTSCVSSPLTTWDPVTSLLLETRGPFHMSTPLSQDCRKQGLLELFDVLSIK